MKKSIIASVLIAGATSAAVATPLMADASQKSAGVQIVVQRCNTVLALQSFPNLHSAEETILATIRYINRHPHIHTGLRSMTLFNDDVQVGHKVRFSCH